jgi:zinc D-Ala-D-Ala dipeptidase
MKKILTIFSYSLILSILMGTATFSNEIEKKFISNGLVDISTIDPTIKVDLVNSNPDKNFFRANYYKGLQKAYLQREIAEKLSQAQNQLKMKFPSYSLQILDAARPRSISKAMYDKMKGTKFERYVANPEKGSMHNYGIAVDITIVDKDGKKLDMGISPFNKTNVQIYWNYLKKKLGKKLTKEQAGNRKLLADSMKKAGFIPLSFEWWHFNGMDKERARKKYKIIE